MLSGGVLCQYALFKKHSMADEHCGYNFTACAKGLSVAYVKTKPLFALENQYTPFGDGQRSVKGHASVKEGLKYSPLEVSSRLPLAKAEHLSLVRGRRSCRWWLWSQLAAVPVCQAQEQTITQSIRPLFATQRDRGIQQNYPPQKKCVHMSKYIICLYVCVYTCA